MRATDSDLGTRERYEELRRLGVEHATNGRLDEAAALLRQALEVASEIADPDLRDRGFCNLSTVLVSLGEGVEVIGGLREILLRSSDPANCRLSAYNIARIYEQRKEAKKGLFYAKIARERGSHVEPEDSEWVASDHNQMGNFLVAESYFEEAIREYEAALAADPGMLPSRRAAICGNLGYCFLMTGELHKGFALKFESLREFRYHRSENLVIVHLDLAFGYLEVGRPRHAERHARKALETAESLGLETEVKNAMYLLGEALHHLGDETRARRQFEQLQSRFEGAPFLADFLLAVDVRRMINLRA